MSALLKGRFSPRSFLRWFDSSSGVGAAATEAKAGLDWVRVLPYLAMHLACFAVIWVGWSPVAIAVAVLLYLVRMLAITGFYHRYFSHRSFKTSRPVQLLFALLGSASAQRGPIWWAAHHRDHHIVSDLPEDPHSPRQHGFFHAHTAWFLTRKHFPTKQDRVRDWLKYPELRFLDRYDILVPFLVALGMFVLGGWLNRVAPHLGTSSGQMLVWGFFVSTVVLYHATFTINSLAHRWGTRRYDTGDDSRNNPWLAIITLGEGWHNNHHHYPASARQGFFWWEVDLTFYVLKFMSMLGLIWDLKPVPAKRLHSNRLNPHSLDD